MDIGMIGLGRMGSAMVQRLLRGGHRCVVHDIHPDAASKLAKDGAIVAESYAAMAAQLRGPRLIWLMVPAGVVDETLRHLVPCLEAGDVIVDGGNSYHRDDQRRFAELQTKGLHYVDIGTSGGVWGNERGYCLMCGGESAVVASLEPILATLAPARASVSPTPSRGEKGHGDKASTAAHGYLHCGPSGAGHFVKMVHNGIEYGLMAAYSEGFNILRHANAGKEHRSADAETTPLRHPEHYQYEFDLPEIAELWRRGSVIGSWLFDLLAEGLAKSPDLEDFSGVVADSGEGRWTIMAAIDESVPAPVLSAALYARFNSRGEGAFANKLLSALRYEFGGHHERPHPQEHA